jgi:hypothetical protein
MTKPLEENQHMRVQREFHNPTIVRWLESVDEQELAEVLEDIAFDREIGEAMEYSKAHDHEKLLTVEEFLAQECNK